MVLSKLPVPGPTNWDLSRYGWGLFGYYLSRISFLFPFSLSLGAGPI